MSKIIYLLDKIIVLELLKSEPNQNVVNKFSECKSKCAISATTWNELLFTMSNLLEGNRKDFYTDFIINYIQKELPILPYDQHAALIHADIRSKNREKGNFIDFQETQNAAIAVSNQMIFVTHNKLYFERLKEVESIFVYEDWFKD